MLSAKRDPPLDGRSLYLFTNENMLRKTCSRVANSKIFEIAIISLIVISTLNLAFESPLDDPNGSKLKVLAMIDVGMTVIFTFEAMLKIIAFGFVLNGKNSYMKSGWNVLDFIIVLSALISLVFNTDLEFFKALRILRVLRPLRLIKRV